MEKLTLAISPCPNDIFIFAPWILGIIKSPRKSFFVFEDVETLNEMALTGAAEIVKVSAALFPKVSNEYNLLMSGAAFGKSVGPKLVVRQEFAGAPAKVAVPGFNTTAAALLKVFLSEVYDPFPELMPLRYDKIVPAVLDKNVDAGLLIHETALVPQNYGLRILQDLGLWWGEKNTIAPLPLGCILAKKSLGNTKQKQLEATIQASLRAAWRDPEQVKPLVRVFAKEINDSLLDEHIATYVSELSLDMGAEDGAGLKAFENLWNLIDSQKAGLT